MRDASILEASFVVLGMVGCHKHSYSQYFLVLNICASRRFSFHSINPFEYVPTSTFQSSIHVRYINTRDRLAIRIHPIHPAIVSYSTLNQSQERKGLGLALTIRDLESHSQKSQSDTTHCCTHIGTNIQKESRTLLRGIIYRLHSFSLSESHHHHHHHHWS